VHAGPPAGTDQGRFRPRLLGPGMGARSQGPTAARAQPAGDPGGPWPSVWHNLHSGRLPGEVAGSVGQPGADWRFE
jgi:hypothetical protein